MMSNVAHNCDDYRDELDPAESRDAENLVEQEDVKASPVGPPAIK